MNPATTLHETAMAHVDAGLTARRAGDHVQAREEFRRALEFEREAAEKAGSQPSVSILFRSAAWLALEAEDAAESERLAACGLSAREVPGRVKQELRAVAEEARLRLHRPLPPPTATPSVTLHLEGPQVGFGAADPADIEPRLGALRSALVRTAERRSRLPFRPRGAPSRAIAEQLQPRLRYAPGSVVIQVTLGGSQADLWDRNGEVVEDVRKALEAYGGGGAKALEPLIADPMYRENFALLAAQLAPDGVRVTSVDVSSASARQTLPLVRLRHREPAIADEEGKAELGRSTRALVGELRGVDETGKVDQIKLVDEQGTVHRVHVREVMLEDLVRPLYGQRVRVTVRERARGRLELVGVPEAAGE